VIEETVVSVGMMRAFAGKELGLGSASIAAIELFVLDAVLTRPASGSVPVFTDQRSTPQVAALAPLDQTTEMETRAADSARRNHREPITRAKCAPRAQAHLTDRRRRCAVSGRLADARRDSDTASGVAPATDQGAVNF